MIYIQVIKSNEIHVWIYYKQGVLHFVIKHQKCSVNWNALVLKRVRGWIL